MVGPNPKLPWDTSASTGGEPGGGCNVKRHNTCTSSAERTVRDLKIHPRHSLAQSELWWELNVERLGFDATGTATRHHTGTTVTGNVSKGGNAGKILRNETNSLGQVNS